MAASLHERLRQLALREEEASGKLLFMGKPDRWWEHPHWRCENDHVSVTYLKSEQKGALCLSCYKPVHLTFPEDRDGPLMEERCGGANAG